LIDADTVTLEGAHEGFAAEVADEAVDLAGFAAANGFFGSRLQARRVNLKTAEGGTANFR
jgi:hypothetical protein